MNEEEFRKHIRSLPVEQLESGTANFVEWAKSLSLYAEDGSFRDTIAEVERQLAALSEEEAHRVAQDLMKQARQYQARQNMMAAIDKTREEIIRRVLLRDEHFDRTLQLARETIESERKYGLYRSEAWERLTILGLL